MNTEADHDDVGYKDEKHDSNCDNGVGVVNDMLLLVGGITTTVPDEVAGVDEANEERTKSEDDENVTGLGGVVDDDVLLSVVVTLPV